MKLAIATTLIASAAAFAPASKVATNSALKAFEGELGSQPPIGFWDPLGLVEDGDQKKFDRLRYVELKHGRIAMLAFMGRTVTQAGIRLPGNIDYEGHSFADIPAGFDAVSQVPGAGLLQLFAFIGFLEIFVMKDITGGEFIGDFRNGFIDFGWDTFDEETKLQKRAIELNNGRAAQMGILGLMVHEKLGTAVPLEGSL
uniref:Uncharacterized protein n=1 Tax=Leptocylindrus danicus TaxID=163516 RepID=A0A7S2NT03_9STRA|eukprot:CAMPEP_0116024192 /NCGR_PEP_ID=MMETSP0321-20121206/12153_1 /TAXON_ID=163516 /ORGANISM="Leptocylindrus danicus var. danicus, Strain B650" /LENGTH=198 /DNA_ID=CAMNT_0003495841 /DNA_START=19 /DNA_END=615 /DNA_ORIENTATION=-